MNVLIADDEPVSRRLLEILLTKWGYEVTVVCDGEEAWRQLQNGAHPRIAILDWMMPGMDGVQVCEKIRQHEGRFSTYVILLTAKKAALGINNKYESVADDFLAKPCAASELRARLRAARRIVELEDQIQEARDAIKMETTHDSLTGLWNRSSILEILQRELLRAKRHASTLAVLMIDINQLRQINYQFGFLAGDAVMREVARRIHSSIRPYDSMGRYGGGQLIIVSPACDQSQALSQAQRVQSKICGEQIKIFEGDFPISITLGIAIASGSHEAHDLISAADAALAEARKSGCNHAAEA